ncbi:hypothetical protein Tco_1157988, partial [Tanacetum coccineum]
PLIDLLDHDARPYHVSFTASSLWKVLHPQVGSNIMKNYSDRCERPVTKLVEFIGAHQSVSLVLVLIDDSLRVIVCSVWGHVGDVKSESLRTGDIQLLLVAFDS